MSRVVASYSCKLTQFIFSPLHLLPLLFSLLCALLLLKLLLLLLYFIIIIIISTIIISYVMYIM